MFATAELERSLFPRGLATPRVAVAGNASSGSSTLRATALVIVFAYRGGRLRQVRSRAGAPHAHGAAQLALVHPQQDENHHPTQAG